MKTPGNPEDVVSIKGFIHWLEGLPPNKKFYYYDNEYCCFAQYLRFLGFKDVSVGGDCYSVGYENFKVPDVIADNLVKCDLQFTARDILNKMLG